jgi:Fic-DOC domain mobile mystery protein B
MMWTIDVDGSTPLDPDEAMGLRHRHVRTRGQLNQLEQENIEAAHRWLSRQRKFKDYLARDFVLALHRQMFGDIWLWAGQLRRTEKNIGLDPVHIDVELKQLMDNSRYWSEHATYTPVEFAARLHHRLVQIHLFPNGNGRHARLYTNIVMERVLQQPRPRWAGPRDDYVAALRSADGGDIGPLIDWLG